MNDFALEWTWLVKITLLLAAVWMVWLVAQKSNPRWQVWPFRAGLLGVVLLSLVSFAPPLLEWPVNVVTTAPQAADEIVLSQPPISQPPRGREQQVVATKATVSELVNRPTERRRTEPQTTLPSAMPEQAASSTVKGWNWLALAVKFWIFIVVVGILRMAAGFWSLRQLVARSTEPSDSVSTVAGKLASALRLAAPTVGVTDEISSPSVVGLLRPMILLPTSIASSENPQALASALSHELAHIAGNDLRWDAALRLFRLLAWPHPLVWGMHRAHRAACEHVSDLVAADLIDDRTAYADCLANIALKLQRSGSDYGLAMAREADVVTRLKTLASGLQAKALGRRGKAAALATMLIAITIGTTTVVQVQQSKAQEPEPVQDSKTVLSEDDDQPLVVAEGLPKDLLAAAKIHFEAAYAAKYGKPPSAATTAEAMKAYTASVNKLAESLGTRSGQEAKNLDNMRLALDKLDDPSLISALDNLRFNHIKTVLSEDDDQPLVVAEGLPKDLLAAAKSQFEAAYAAKYGKPPSAATTAEAMKAYTASVNKLAESLGTRAGQEAKSLDNMRLALDRLDGPSLIDALDNIRFGHLGGFGFTKLNVVGLAEPDMPVNQMDGKMLATDPKLVLNLKENTEVIFSAGAYSLDERAMNHTLRRAGKKFPKGVAFVGAGKGKTTLKITDAGFTRFDVDRLSFRDMTIDCDNDGLFDKRQGSLTLRLSNVTLVRFDAGHGGCRSFSINDGLIVHATDSEFVGGHGSSPGHGSIFDSCDVFLGYFQRCAFSGIEDDLFRSIREPNSILWMDECKFDREYRANSSVEFKDCEFDFKPPALEWVPQDADAR